MRHKSCYETLGPGSTCLQRIGTESRQISGGFYDNPECLIPYDKLTTNVKNGSGAIM
jgi:hypothetical protein